MSVCPYCQGEDGCEFVGSSRPYDMNALTVADWGELYDFLRQVYLPFVHKLLARAQARGPARPERAVALVAQGFLRDYRSGGYRSCAARLHDDEDLEVDVHELLRQALRIIPEGQVVRIEVVDTGMRHPLADDPWVLLGEHTYGPQSKVRAPECSGG